MPDGYHHLGYDERSQLYILKQDGFSIRAIAHRLKRSPSTISRELRRNVGQRGYRHQQAQRFSKARRKQASTVPRKLTPERWSWIERQLTEKQWSPDQISGRMTDLGGVSLSASWIYRLIWSDRDRGGDLYRHLRHRGKKYNRRGKSGSGRGVIPHRVDISERPAVVEDKVRVGDWEADTVIGGGHRGALVTLVDRASKFTLIQRVERRTAAQVGAAICSLLGPWKASCHTLTADNGKEFADHQVIAEALEMEVYFATPYHSWERGLNEHTNGLIRQYFPKGHDFLTVSEEEVRQVQDRLNGRPRKVLGYRTPAEVFAEGMAAAR